MAATGEEFVLLRQLKTLKDWIVTQLSGKASSSHTHSSATDSSDGFMSASDKAKLDDLSTTIPIATTSRVGGFKLKQSQSTSDHGGLEMGLDGVLQLKVNPEFLSVLTNGQLSIVPEFEHQFSIPVIITGTSSNPILQTNGRAVSIRNYDTLFVLSDSSDMSRPTGTILQVSGISYDGYKVIYETPTEINGIVLEELYVPPETSPK